MGGNGILLENHVMRHMVDIEAIHTFEGTETVQNPIVGRDITGVSAFSWPNQPTRRRRRCRLWNDAGITVWGAAYHLVGDNSLEFRDNAG
ncbi:MAG TPA: hypothetical protein VGO16_15545 [Pseudonocardiaceae bacterium]|nr:hypothetical protein [Pseudonocardiaceae bacterium]